MKRSLTVIIAVYNAVRYLELILAALQRQSMMDFEIIVADDGSGPEIKSLVDRSKTDLPVSLLHLWQPDQGFRKNAMLNKAICASGTDYLVFIDGDCIPHHDFVKDHWTLREPAGVLCGRRVNFSRQITERITIDDVRTGKIEKISFRMLFDGLLARSSNLEDAIRLESPGLRRILHRNRARILGCNFSVEKRLLEKINGFNEDYHSPGIGEDSDIAFRLELIGARMITLRYLAVLYHLYHPVTTVGEANKKIFERVVEMNEAVCSNGLRKFDAMYHQVRA